MPWQSLPGLVIVAGAIAGIGAFQGGVHYLFHGEVRRFDAFWWSGQFALHL